MFEALGAAGSALGSGLGGFLGHALGGLGSVLSAPGRGVRNLLGLPEDSAAFIESQGLDPNSMSSSAAGLAYDMLTDPLTYAGGFLGKLGGRALGAAAGGNLERAALARGPRYGGGLSKLEGAAQTRAGMNKLLVPGELPGAMVPGPQTTLEKFTSSPHANRLLEELPEGSRIFGDSNNALAFRTPAGDVVRFGQESRAAIPEMLQPTRSVQVGDWTAERLPFADRVGDRALYAEHAKPMIASVRAQPGLRTADFHPGNMGLIGDRPVMIDPGAVAALPGHTLPTASSIEASEPGRLTNWLLDRLDATNRVRRGVSPAPHASEFSNALAGRLGGLLGYSG